MSDTGPELINPKTREYDVLYARLLYNSGILKNRLPYMIQTFFDQKLVKKWVIKNTTGSWTMIGQSPCQFFFDNEESSEKFKKRWTLENPKFHEIHVVGNKLVDIRDWVSNNIKAVEVGLWRNYGQMTIVYEIPNDEHAILFKLTWC